MMMSNEHYLISQIDLEIIEYLITCHDYCDSYEIARTLGINRRRVRSEIANVKEILEDFGYTLESKRSKGYRIMERDHFNELQQKLRSISFENSSNYAYSQAGRRYYLMEMLVLRDDYLKIDDLADTLYVSRSTIINDLASLDNVLSKNNIILENRPRTGVRLIAEEISKREMLCDCFFNIYARNDYYNLFLDSFTDEQCEMEYSIYSTLKRHNIVMSDIALCDFLIYLTVMCMRISAGKTLDKSPDISQYHSLTEYDVASIIATQISNHLNVIVNEYEVNYIFIKIIAKESSLIRKSLTISDNTYAIARDALKNIRSETGISLEEDDNFQRFCNYIESAVMVIKYHEKIRHPYYSVVRENYPLEYTLSQITSDTINKFLDYRITSSQIAFFTMFFNNWIQAIRNRKREVLLICGLGVGATESVQNKLEYRLGNYLEIKNTCMYQELKQQDLSEYDVIITTLPLPARVEIPVVTISQFVTDDDLNQVLSTITSDYYNYRPELSYVPDLFMVREKMADMKAIFTEMTGQICDLFPKLKPSYVNTLMESPQNYYSSLNNGFLFIRLDKSLNSLDVAGVCLMKEPLEYNGEPIHVVVIVSSGNHDYYRSLREATRPIGRDELLRLISEKDINYVSFIHLYQDE